MPAKFADEPAEIVNEGDDLYDPNQDPEEKRQIRAGYRDQLKELEDKAKDFKTLDLDYLTNRVGRANQSFNKVRAPQEAILDSRYLTTLSSLGAAKARDFRHDGGGFDTDDFINQLVAVLGGARLEVEEDDDEEFEAEGELNWSKLGWELLSISRRAPGIDFMLGPLSIEQKKRAQQKRQKVQQDDGPAIRPKEVKEGEEAVPGENITQQDVALVSDLYDLLDKEGPINVFKLCLNPDSFAQTVENFFYLSFLLRDCKAAAEVDDNGDMIVYAAEPPTAEDVAQGMTKRQAVWELDYETFELAKKTYNITEALFPARPVPPDHTYAFYGR